ncbi:alternate-type signal peptide domain-containing protein [Microbacterium sp. NPDC089320]|uniref:alternate-type signal peptide domain-containing protein n=1 Tax=Microbacterium sp. NPDC089320 TaxID=3155182 RepID=UPI00343B92A9
MAAAPLLVGLLLAAASAGGTSALWSAGTTVGVGDITSGNLRLVSMDTTWRQVTPGTGDTDERPLTGTPADFRAMPGDVVTITQHVESYLQGDNLHAGLAVDYARGSDAARAVADGRISLSFHIEDAEGVQVAPENGTSPFGTTLAVGGLTGTDAGAVEEWRVVVTARILGDYDWVDGGSVDDAPVPWAAGTIVISLEQLRDHPGHVDGGTP